MLDITLKDQKCKYHVFAAVLQAIIRYLLSRNYISVMKKSFQ